MIAIDTVLFSLVAGLLGLKLAALALAAVLFVRALGGLTRPRKLARAAALRLHSHSGA